MSGAPMEARAGIAWWEGRRLVHHSSCQGAHPTRDVLARLYGLDPADVRVVVPDVGGGFGVKSRTYSDEATLGALARLVGRPVRWVETRREHMVANPQGRGQQQHIRIGGTRDGRITAYQLDVVQDVGGYPLIGALLPGMTMRMLTGVYDIANVGFSAQSVVTNKVPTTAFRGAGRPEATVAIERAVDAFAAEIGMDPADVRRRNLVPRFLDPYTTGIGTTYDVGDFPASFEGALDAAGYSDAARRASTTACRGRPAPARHRARCVRGDHRRRSGQRARHGLSRPRRPVPRRHRGDADGPGPRHDMGDGRRRSGGCRARPMSTSSTVTPTSCPAAA